MASTHKCEYCSSTITSEDPKCPYCGAENPNYVPDSPRQIFLPKTIDELKEYCAERGMPLLRMRFFIGEDYREPKAFGIYRDGDEIIVYKNKADGSRAIRYRGRDEAHAVDEIFAKLLEECHNRGIYPDGKGPEPGTTRQPKRRSLRQIMSIVFAVLFVLSAVSTVLGMLSHRHDGYYHFGGNTVYYHYGSDWYYTYDDNMAGYWYAADDPPVSSYSDYYVGEDWDSDWGVSNFKESSTWESLRESHSSSSSDYDSWDSSDTDWDSDW